MYPSSFFAGKEKNKVDARHESKNVSCNGSKIVESCNNNSSTKEQIDNNNNNNNRWSSATQGNDNIKYNGETKNAIYNFCSGNNNSSGDIGNNKKTENVTGVENRMTGIANSTHFCTQSGVQEYVASPFTPASAIPPHSPSQPAVHEMKVNGYVNTDYSVPLHMQRYNNEAVSNAQTSHFPHAPPPLVNLNTRLAKERATMEPQYHNNISNSYHNTNTNYNNTNNVCPPYEISYRNNNDNNNTFYPHNSNYSNTNSVLGQWPQPMIKPQSNIPIDNNNNNSNNITSWSHAQHPSYLQDAYSYSHPFAHNENYSNNLPSGCATVNSRNNYNINTMEGTTANNNSGNISLASRSLTLNDYKERGTTLTSAEHVQQRWSEPVTCLTQSRETESSVNVNVGYETHPLPLKASTSNMTNNTTTHSSGLTSNKLMSPSKKLIMSLQNSNEPHQPLVLSRPTAVPVNVAKTPTTSNKDEISLFSVNASSDVQQTVNKPVTSPLSYSDTAMCNRIGKEPYVEHQSALHVDRTLKKEIECDAIDSSTTVNNKELEKSNTNTHAQEITGDAHKIAQSSESDKVQVNDTLYESSKQDKDAQTNNSIENSKTNSNNNSNDKTKPLVTQPKRSAMYPSYFFHAEKKQQNTHLATTTEESESSSSTSNNQTTTVTSINELQKIVEENLKPNESTSVSRKSIKEQPVEEPVRSDEHATLPEVESNVKNVNFTPVCADKISLYQMESIKSVENDINNSSKSNNCNLHTKTDSNLSGLEPSYYYRHNNVSNTISAQNNHHVAAAVSNNNNIINTTSGSSCSCSDKELSTVNTNETNEHSEHFTARIGFHARSASTPLSTPPTTFQSAKSFSSYVQPSPMHERNMTNISTYSNNNNNINCSYNYNLSSAQERYTPPPPQEQQPQQPQQPFIQPYYAQQNNFQYMQPYQQPYSFSQQQQQQQQVQPNMMGQPNYNVNLTMYGGNTGVPPLPPPPPPLPLPLPQQQQIQQQSTFYSANQLLPPMVPTLQPQLYFSPTSQNQTQNLTPSPAHSYASSSAAHVRSVAESFPSPTTFSRELMNNSNNNINNSNNVATQAFTGNVFDMNSNNTNNSINNYNDMNALNVNNLVEAHMTPLTNMNTIPPLFGANTFANNNYSVNDNNNNNNNSNYTNGFMTNVPYFLQTCSSASAASPSSTLALPFKHFTNTLTSNNDDTTTHIATSSHYNVNNIVPQVIYEHYPNNEEVWMEEMDSQRKFNAETFGNIVSLLDAFAPHVLVKETLEIPCWNAAYYTYGCAEDENSITNEHENDINSSTNSSKNSDSVANNYRERDSHVDESVGNAELANSNNDNDIKFENSNGKENSEEREYESCMSGSNTPVVVREITLEHLETLDKETEDCRIRSRRRYSYNDENKNNKLLEEEECYVDFTGPSALEPIVKLEDIWRSFDEPFGYTISLVHPIQLTETRIKEESVTYVPMLSGFRIKFHSHSIPYKQLVQISINESESSSNVCSSHGLLTWSASERPDNRNNLVEQIAELVHSHICFKPLLTATTADVDHQSWIALLWQPVFCGTHSAKNTCGSFLVYYLLRPPRQLFTPYVGQSEWARVNGDVQSCVFRADRAAVACDLWSFSRKYNVARVVNNNITKQNSIGSDCKKNVSILKDIVGEEPHATDNISKEKLLSSPCMSSEKGLELPEHSTEIEPASPTIVPCKDNECNKTHCSHDTHSQESQNSCIGKNTDASDTTITANSTSSKKKNVKAKIRIPIVGLLPNRCRADVWFEPQYLPPPSANYTNTASRHPFFENNNNNNNNNLYQMGNIATNLYSSINNTNTTVSTSPRKIERLASSWCYRAPLFLIASALQLMSWNACMEHKRINKNKLALNDSLNSPQSNKSADNNDNNNTYKYYYEEGVTLLVEAARRYRSLREAALIDTNVSSLPLSSSLLLLKTDKPTLNNTNRSSLSSSETESNLENNLNHTRNGNAKNEKAQKSCNEELKSNEVKKTSNTVRSTEKVITRTEQTKIAESTIIAGGTNSLLCKQHASVIVGLLDFYQWMQYDAALVQFAEKYC